MSWATYRGFGTNWLEYILWFSFPYVNPLYHLCASGRDVV